MRVNELCKESQVSTFPVMEEAFTYFKNVDTLSDLVCFLNSNEANVSLARS